MHRDGREYVSHVSFRLSSVAAAPHAVPVGELVDGAFHPGADRVAGLPLGCLLIGADADLRIAEFSRAKPTFRALSRELVHRGRSGHS